jgi:hypothetical protein
MKTVHIANGIIKGKKFIAQKIRVCQKYFLERKYFWKFLKSKLIYFN